MSQHTLFLAAPRGFCAGVDRAIDIVEMAIEIYGAPIWVRHEIVHNRHVVEALRAKGAIFTDDLADVPSGATVIFSAHGVSPAVRKEAVDRGLRTLAPRARSSPRCTSKRCATRRTDTRSC
jgi:4-hydroxy-3-methylbut-2-enyl diphosphate reductase